LLKDFEAIIKGCVRNDRRSQELLFKEYYAYAMTICLPYSNTDFEAEEIVNDGFIKVMKSIKEFDPKYPFKGWMRRIMINTAIDHFRSNKKHYYALDIDEAVALSNDEVSALDQLSADDLMGIVRELPKAYQTTFMLYAVEGYKHHEIAKKLGISEGTSKSNYAKAKKKLQARIITKQNGASNG